MALISYFPWQNGATRPQLLKLFVVMLPLLPLQAYWETPNISIGTSIMPLDADIQDIQNFRALVVDLKMWQSPTLKNTLIFMTPVTFSFFQNSQSERMFCNACTLKAEAFFMPLTDDRRFAFFITSSFGPALFEKRRLGSFRQGGNVGFQSTFGLGTYFTQRCSLTAYILHYCSAGLYKKNRGLTLPILTGGISY